MIDWRPRLNKASGNHYQNEFLLIAWAYAEYQQRIPRRANVKGAAIPSLHHGRTAAPYAKSLQGRPSGEKQSGRVDSRVFAFKIKIQHLDEDGCGERAC